MAHISLDPLKGPVDDSRKNEISETVQPERHIIDDQNQSDEKDSRQTTEVDTKDGTNVKEKVSPAKTDAPGDINMEASVLADDVMRAGGFGARDDMSSFLPVASDSTDFEASLLDAREYEEPQEPQEEIKRPGLGWTEAQK